jgi:hypothetical protein
MVKKFLLSAAVVGALATSAMAYDNINTMTQNATLNIADTTADIVRTGNQLGNALIFPAYFVGSGWETTIRVINTDPNRAIVAKVVLYDGNDSHEVKDFNIYLSANDEWTGTIKVDSDGVAKVISTDDSAPLRVVNGVYKMASADNPMKEKITSANGYIEVIGMVATTQSAHNDHVNLRKAYDKFSKDARGQNNPIFKNGVITNKANFPFIDMNKTNNNVDLNKDNKPDYTFNAIGAMRPNNDVLTGDIRITDTVNGKDMVFPAIGLNIYNGAHGAGVQPALVYLEGEAANIADVEIDNTPAYNNNNLAADLASLANNATNAYITYGDAPVNNMYAIITSPLKRVLVRTNFVGQKNITNGSVNSAPKKALFTGIDTDAAGNIKDYGQFSLIAQIFDTKENAASASQFSPADTPTIVFKKEVDTTGYDPSDLTKLPHYLTQAAEQGFTKGYVKLTNAVSGQIIPGIVTQMIATKAGNRVVTNWITPAVK